MSIVSSQSVILWFWASNMGDARKRGAGTRRTSSRRGELSWPKLIRASLLGASSFIVSLQGSSSQGRARGGFSLHKASLPRQAPRGHCVAGT